MRTFLVPVVQGVLAVAGLAWMVVLLLAGPTTIVEYNGGQSLVRCRSVIEAADTPKAPFPLTDQDSAIYQGDNGDTHPDDDANVLGWCDDARSARTGYAAVLAVPTAALGALAVVAVHRRTNLSAS
jgi:hypothetical protein